MIVARSQLATVVTVIVSARQDRFLRRAEVRMSERGARGADAPTGQLEARRAQVQLHAHQQGRHEPGYRSLADSPPCCRVTQPAQSSTGPRPGAAVVEPLPSAERTNDRQPVPVPVGSLDGSDNGDYDHQDEGDDA